MHEALSWRLEPRPLSLTLYKHLFLWSEKGIAQLKVVINGLGVILN